MIGSFLQKGGGFTGGTVADNTTFSGNVIVQGTLDVTGVATFTTTVTGSGNIMAGAAFAVGFTGRGQWKSSADGLLEAYSANGSTLATVRVVAGTSSAVGLRFAQGANWGFYETGSGIMASIAGTAGVRLDLSGVMCNGGGSACEFRGTSGNADSGTADVGMYRVGAGVFGMAGGVAKTSIGGFQPAQSANGCTLRILMISESLTLDTGDATTDTTTDLLPANSIIFPPMTRATTAITTAVNFDVGDTLVSATRFATDSTAVALNATATHTTAITTGIASATAGIWQPAADKIRITCNATPGAGVLRITVPYILLTPPTS